MNTGSSQQDSNTFTRQLAAPPKLWAVMQPAPDDQNGDSIGLVQFLLMLLWGQTPGTRRPPRVLLERKP